MRPPLFEYWDALPFQRQNLEPQQPKKIHRTESDNASGALVVPVDGFANAICARQTRRQTNDTSRRLKEKQQEIARENKPASGKPEKSPHF
jgi:hypothetical protein